MNVHISRVEWSQVTAEAYIRQYASNAPRMNNVIIVYDLGTNHFSAQSSLTPLNDEEIKIDTLAEGMFGDTSDISANELQEELEAYLQHDAHDAWEEILWRIAEGNENRKENTK